MSSSEGIDVFISHSYEDRALAKTIKEELAKYGVKAFIAHEDIDPTVEWQDAILQALKNCKALIALLTHNFEKSKWTDQETGIAVAFDKFIVPISIELVPYGFIGRFQALRWRSDAPQESLASLCMIFMQHDVISKDGLIEWFTKSSDYYQANDRAAVLQLAAPFTKPQVDAIIDGALNNNQLTGGWGSSSFLRDLKRKQGDMVDPVKWIQLVKWLS